ncbi:MAG: sulfatase [Planctomycetota bacterium]|jgi:arylsulfatase A-like enzyme
MPSVPVRRPLLAAPLLILGLLAAACGEREGATGTSEHAETVDEAVPPALVRLWLDAPAPERIAEFAPHRLVLGAEQARAATWLRLRHGTTERLAFEAFVPGSTGPDLLQHREYGVALRIPATPGEALRVRLELGAPDTSPTDALATSVLVELDEPLQPEQGLPMDDLEEMFRSKAGESRRVWAHFEAGRAILQRDLIVGRGTAELLLVLLTPALGAPERGPVRVESLEVWRRAVAVHASSGAEVPGVTRSPDGQQVQAQFDRDRHRGLLGVPGMSYTFTLPPDSRARRLEMSVGILGRPASLLGAVRIGVLADGALVFDELLSAPAAYQAGAWRDVSVELPAGCSELVLFADGEGDDPPLAVFGHPSLRARTDDPRPNVVLISLDTLRPDRLGCYGAEPSHSPRLDALAAEGLLFRAAYSTSSYTLPSHASMLSGQHPLRHGLVERPGRLQRGRSPALAEMLADAGYVTAAFTGGGFVGAAFGLDRGFDRFSHNDPVWAIGTVRGEQLIEVDGVPSERQRALLERYATPMITRWIERQDDGVPFFLFLHTYIVHSYAPDRRRIEKHRLLDPFGNERPLDNSDLHRFNGGQPFLRRAVLDQYVPFYDATIEMGDEFVGEVLDALDAAGLGEDTLVLVTSDHGEEFGEHGYFGHGHTLFDANARVPLIVRLPADPDGRLPVQPAVHDGLISLADLAPWILRTVGLEPDPRMAVEPPLGPEQSMPPVRSHVVLDLDTAEDHVRAVRRGALKLHVRGSGEASLEGLGLVQLYDLESDPAEWHDLGAGTPQAWELHGLLARFTQHAEAMGEAGSAEDEAVAPLDEEVLESLRQLGYIDGAAPGDAPEVGAPPAGDPPRGESGGGR